MSVPEATKHNRCEVDSWINGLELQREAWVNGIDLVSKGAKELMLLNCGDEQYSWDLDYKEFKPVNPKGNQPSILIGRTDAEAETPILWLPDMDSQLTGKDPGAGIDWRQKEKKVTQDEMVGWHHWFNGHELGQTLRDDERQVSLACWSPWGHKKLDTIWWLNNNNISAHWNQRSGKDDIALDGKCRVEDKRPSTDHWENSYSSIR